MIDARLLAGLALLALVVVTFAITFVTLWMRGRIARDLANGRRDSVNSRRWPWYR